jgi:phosphatidylinositol alpha-1,6-mannosyltransferase
MNGKVLVVTNDFPPRRGGIESFVASLCVGLPADQLVVYTASMPGDAVHDASLGYPVVRDRSGCLLPTPRVSRAAQEVVRRHGCDRVLFGAAAPLGLLAAGLRSAGVRRMVGLTHGHEVWWAHTPGARSLLRRIGEGVDVLTYVSRFCGREIGAALSRSAAERMVRLSPGVDVERFSPLSDGRERTAAAERAAAGIAAGRPLVLAAARLVSRKGHDTLVKAWPAVVRQIPEAALLILGDGPQEGALRRRVHSLDLGESVFFSPSVPQHQMPAFYSAADAFALPCRTRRGGLEVEALGIVFLEAAAAGLPVVVGASGGAPETVVDGETGYVVNPVDRAAVAERIVGLLSDPVRSREMGAAGRARVVAQWSQAQSVATLKHLFA